MRLHCFVAAVALVLSGAACSSSSSKSSASHVPPTTAAPVGPQLVGAGGYPDHWHAALGVNVCGTWQPGPIWPSIGTGTLTRADAPNVYAGLHTHQLNNGQSDGLIHMEPNQPDEAGRNATLGRYMEFGGWKVTPTSLQLWPGAHDQPIALRNGQKCGSQAAVVRWATGSYVPGKGPTPLTERHGDPARLQLADNQAIALYFVPQSTALSSLGEVPSITNLPSAQTAPSAITTTTART